MRAPARAGFTLIEVLAVLVLSAMLIAATFQAIHTQSRLNESGRRQVERSVVRRGVADDLASDIRAAVVPDRSLDARLEVTQPFQTTDFSEQYLDLQPGVPTLVGFYGDERYLLIETAQVNERFLTPEREDAEAGSHRSRQIVWFCSGQTRRVPISREGDRLRHSNVDAQEQPLGLTRLEWTAQSGSRLRSLTPQSVGWTTVDPETRELRFRYFDGRSWHAEWNGYQRGGLPRAVEITRIDQNQESQRLVVHLSQGEAP